MPSYTLHYFGGRGLGEVSRQLFALSGTPFEDKRHNHDEWPQHRASTPFGQLPVLEVDDKKIPQSWAIARYLAREFGYAGKTNFDQAWVDALGDQFKDYAAEIRPYFMVVLGFGEGDLAKLEKEVGVPARDKFYNIIEKQLGSSKSGFLVGDSLTWIDLALADHVDVVIAKNPHFLDAFPKTLEHRKKVQAVPAIHEWIEKRPKTPF